jgi:hypothetical protein
MLVVVVVVVVAAVAAAMTGCFLMMVDCVFENA